MWRRADERMAEGGREEESMGVCGTGVHGVWVAGGAGVCCAGMQARAGVLGMDSHGQLASEGRGACKDGTEKQA